ncbi:MAG: flagellar hook-length control protein FliK [Acidobacteria bacterium]|nr:flagellar hook-length control protein FliK [Acidobacteriota bacterium]
MSIQVVGVNPGGDAPDVHGAESREDGPSFAGLFEQVKKSKPPAQNDRKVERGEDDSREAQAQKSSDAADGAAVASGSEDVVAPVQQQERRAQEASPGRRVSESGEEGETAVGRSTPQSSKEGVPVAPRQSLLEANQELNLMLRFTAAASPSFEMQLKQTAAGQPDMAMLVPRKEVPLPVKEATRPQGETDHEKPERAPAMAKGAADSRDAVRAETGRPAEGAASGEPDGAPPQAADPRADRGSITDNPDTEPSIPQKSRGGESVPTQSPSQRASTNAAVAEVRVDETATDAASEMAKPVTSDPLAKTGTVGPKLTAPAASAAPQQMAAPEVDLANQIVQSAKLLLKNGQESIEIRLKPDILGKLFMRIEVVDRAMTAQMTVQSEQVKTMIESQLQTLQTALESSGLRLNRVAISVEDSQRADSQKSDSWNHERASPDDQDGSRDDNKDEEPDERSRRPPRNPTQVHIRV